MYKPKNVLRNTNAITQIGMKTYLVCTQSQPVKYWMAVQ